MNKGWLELESDPGLFTLLVEDFGVNSIQVEEIYDLQKPIEGTVYGFIFLFRWIEERRCRRKTSTEDESFVMDENKVNSIFFAKQIIPNSCATHALLSVLLNSEKVRLGETLDKFKCFTRNMSPEDKGFAIGNMAELASAHNSHARPEPKHLPEKQPTLSTVRTMEAFHFVSYVPIHGRLFELDGLKPFPIDHGPCESSQMWTEKFRSVISDRLGMATGGEPYHDIRFNLMAVVPCKRQLFEHKLQTLKTNRQIVLEALQQLLDSKMVKVTTPGLTSDSKGQAHIITDSVRITNNLSKAAEKISKSQYHNKSSEFNMKNCVADDAETTSVKQADPMSVEHSLSESKNDVLKDSEHFKCESASESQTVRDKGVKIQISVSEEKDGSITIPRTVSLTDVTKPLTIETKFASLSGPSSESTDTASEVGSVFSSPGSFHTQSCQSSPQLSADCVPPGDVKTEPSSENSMCMPAMVNSNREPLEGRTKSKHRSASQGFSPKDLLDLLKNVENEIETCEANLKEENEKRKKFKIDDCRRTHNYDQFITTFLTMLAEQGHLAHLVEQNVNLKKRQDDDILINPKEFSSVSEGDVLEIYNPENEYRRLLLQVQSLSEDFQQKDTVSIEQSIATAFHLRAYKDVCINKIDPKNVALDLVELLYKEQYYSRSDMWRLRQNLVGTCVYLNKKIEFAEMRAQVNEMWSKGDRVTCGVIRDNTRVVFRSSTAVVQIFIQMSSEMWDFDINGDLYFEKAVNGFLTDLFAKWKEQNCCHDVTIVLFSRTFYDAKSLDEFPNHLRLCLQVDHQGRIFEDFYRVVIQNERYDEWTNTLKLLRKYFNKYDERVVSYHKNEGYQVPRSWNSTAARGNFLETLNMSLNLFENYYLDRNFDRTGKVSVVITPGPGVFEVNRELTNITKQRTIDCGVGSDLVCMGEQPLHAAPLFKFHSTKSASSIEVGDDYNIPHWMNHSYYASKNQIQTHNNFSFVPRIKPPPELLQRLAEKPKNPTKDAIPPTSHDSDDDNFPFVDYNEYDSQIFKLPSRSSTRVSSGRSSSFYLSQRMKRQPQTLAEARQQHHPRTRNLSDELLSLSSELAEKRASSNVKSNSSMSQVLSTSSISQLTSNISISPAVSIPSRSSSGDDISSSVGCYRIQEKTSAVGSVDSSEGEDGTYRRLVVGSAGSPIGHSRRSLLNYRPHRALINPFAPSRMRFKMTSNRRRWVHAFPTDPQGAAVQPHHVHIQSSSYHSDDDHDYGLQTLTPEVVQAAQMAVQARKRVSVSRQESGETETPDFVGQDGVNDGQSLSPSQSESRAMMNTMYQQLSSSSASAETVKPVLCSHGLGHSSHMDQRDRFWLWGTGEQEWSPDMTTGWDWRPLNQNETNNTESQLIKTIISADMNSQNFCAGISVDWKSLTIPASLPITTDFFPEKRSLHYDYVVSDYTLLPDDNSDYGSKTSHTEDESFYRRKPPSTVEVFKELISQRLAQGFQMIKYGKNGSPGETVQLGSSPQYLNTSGLMRSRPPSVQYEEYHLSIGRIFHKLTLSGPAITVTRYRPRHPQPELLHQYQYRFQAPDSYSYDVSFTEFRNQRLENYNWNYLDQYICTRGEGDYGLIDTLKYWRSRFFVLPCNNPATKKIIDGSSRCDIYEEKSPRELNTMINGFVKMVEILNKLKRSQTRRSKVIPQPDSPAAGSADSSPGKPTEQESHKDKDDRLSVSSSSGKLIEALLDDKNGLFFLPKQTGLSTNCFISEEAVSWCQQFVHGVATIDQAVAVMQRLMDEKLLYHASGNAQHKFIFGFYIYCIPPSKGKPETLNLPYSNCAYNMLFQNEVMEVTCVPATDEDDQPMMEAGGGKFFLPDPVQQEPVTTSPAVTIDDWRVQTGMVKQGWGQQLGKIILWAKNATLLHKYVSVDVDAGKSKRPEWATARYHAYYSPACAFELQVQWMVTTGCLLGDLVFTWMRKAGSCGFHLLPVPVDPFALPNTENSDPLRGPIFVPLKINKLADGNNQIFCYCENNMQQDRILQLQEAIVRRYGFMKTHVDLQKAGHKAETSKSSELRNQYVHCTGGMFILIPDSELSSSVSSDVHYSAGFTKKSSSDLHKDYIARQQTNMEEANNDAGGIGFLWSWNFMLSKRWRSGNTGDEHFQDKMLADFRVFCSNEDGRLTEFWEEYQGKRL